MRKTLAAVIASLMLVFAAAPAVGAWDPRPPVFPNGAVSQPGQPALPACADPANMPLVASNWADFEAQCSAVVTPELREFTNLLEVLVGYYAGEALRLGLESSRQHGEIALQSSKIERQRERIERLRERVERLRSRL